MSDVVGEVKDRAQQAGDKATQAMGAASQQGQEVAGKALGRVRIGLDQQSTVVGQRVKTVAQQVRTVGAELRSQGLDFPAGVANDAAQRGDQLGDYISRLDADESARLAAKASPAKLVGSVADFGRRQPWALAAIGFTLGLLPSRLIKGASSSSQAPAPTTTTPPVTTPTGGADIPPPESVTIAPDEGTLPPPPLADTPRL